MTAQNLPGITGMVIGPSDACPQIHHACSRQGAPKIVVVAHVADLQRCIPFQCQLVNHLSLLFEFVLLKGLCSSEFFCLSLKELESWLSLHRICECCLHSGNIIKRRIPDTCPPYFLFGISRLSSTCKQWR